MAGSFLSLLDRDPVSENTRENTPAAVFCDLTGSEKQLAGNQKWDVIGDGLGRLGQFDAQVGELLVYGAHWNNTGYSTSPGSFGRRAASLQCLYLKRRLL